MAILTAQAELSCICTFQANLPQEYTGSGGISLGGSATASSSSKTSISFTATWNVLGIVGISKAFTWTTGQAPLMWYQVQGCCTKGDGGCANTGISNPSDAACSGAASRQMAIVMIMARSVTDVCNQLTEQNFNWPICSILRNSIPAEPEVIAARAAAGANESCNVLIPVPFEQIPACLNFTVDYKTTTYMGMVFSANVVFVFPYTATGGVHLNGSAVAFIPPYIYDGSGDISLGGSAVVRSSGFSYTPPPHGPDIIIGGEAIFRSSYWIYNANGGIVLAGQAEVVSPFWQYTASGGILLDGSAVVGTNLSFTSTGYSGPDFAALRPSGSASSRGTDYRYRYVGEGGINLDGTGFTTQSFFSYTGEGGITLGGEAVWESSRFVYVGRGGVHVGGSYSTILPPYTASGGATLGGQAVLRRFYSYIAEGGIEASGFARTVSPYYIYPGTGGITLGGAAYTYRNYFNQLIVYAGMQSLVTDLGVNFSQQNSPVTLVAPTTTIPTNCDCQSLPLILFFQSNLSSGGQLADFLTANNLTFPDSSNMTYDTKNAVWRSNIHLRSSNTSEKWNIVAEWSCVTQVGSYALGNSMWQFSLLVKRNTGTKQWFDARVLTVFSPQHICVSGNIFDFSFQINTTQNLVIVSPSIILNTQILYDNIGLFRSPDWLANPLLNIDVTELSPAAAGSTLNISSMIQAPNTAGV